ncbi:hypothetical protein MXB_542, partial [Myxobolus squamalis]
RRLGSIDKVKCVSYIQSCLNFDGSYGAVTGAESHGAQVYCCVGSLILLGQRHLIKYGALGVWLCERQCLSGGFNGRPEKLPDSCYSWWILSSLYIIKKQDWFDQNKLLKYLMACQDAETGGFADRPEDYPDAFHTLFSLCGLSLLGFERDLILPINPISCLPNHLLNNRYPELSDL